MHAYAKASHSLAWFLMAAAVTRCRAWLAWAEPWKLRCWQRISVAQRLSALDWSIDAFHFQSLIRRPGHWQSGWQMDPRGRISSSKNSCISRWIEICKPPSISRDNYKKRLTLQRITEKL